MGKHHKDEEKTDCNGTLTFFEMLLIMMILYFFYDLILLEKKKSMNPIIKILSDIPKNLGQAITNAPKKITDVKIGKAISNIPKNITNRIN